MAGGFPYTNSIYEKLSLNAEDIDWLIGAQPYEGYYQNYCKS